jgi:hypothetical protein
MIGSDHDGEVLNAARLAHQTLKSHKVTMAEFLGAVNSSAPTQNGAANRAARGVEWQAGYVEGFEKGKKIAMGDMTAAYNDGFAMGVKSVTSTPRTWQQWSSDRLDNDQDFLSSWEIDFFTSFVRGVRPTPTVKQYGVFSRVALKLGIALPEHDPHDWGYA